MILSPEIEWRYIPPGAVVLHGVPRAVISRSVGALHERMFVLLEGLDTPLFVMPFDVTHLVALDADDAIATLARAGFNPEGIGP